MEAEGLTPAHFGSIHPSVVLAGLAAAIGDMDGPSFTAKLC